MSDAEWPETCDLATCAKLFRDAGLVKDPSSLSRYIADKNFPSTKEGRSRFVSPKALFIAFGGDYTRRKMSGDAFAPVPQLPQAAPTPAPPPQTPRRDPIDDPRLERDRVSLQQKQIELARELGRLVPIAEVAATAAESWAEFRACIGELARDHADALVLALHLPASDAPKLAAALKAFGRACQTRFVEPQKRLLAAMHTPGEPAHDRFLALIRFAMAQRGETDTDTGEQVSEGAAAPSESSGEA